LTHFFNAAGDPGDPGPPGPQGPPGPTVVMGYGGFGGGFGMSLGCCVFAKFARSVSRSFGDGIEGKIKEDTMDFPDLP